MNLRLSYILDEKEWEKVNNSGNVVILPEEAIEETGWTLPDLLKQIEYWFLDLKIDLIVLDHIQFDVEGATAVTGEQEYHTQRLFMRNMRILMKSINKRLGAESSKTFIYISHVNKGAGVGMDKILGSSALQHTATKVLSVAKSDDPGCLDVQMWKSRFTVVRPYALTLKLDGTKLVPLVRLNGGKR